MVEAEQKAETKAKEELQKFWSQYEPLLMKASEGSSLHDIARMTYVVKNDMVPEEYDDAENQVSGIILKMQGKSSQMDRG